MLCCAALAACSLAPPAAAQSSRGIQRLRGNIVKVYVTRQDYDYRQPWQNAAPQQTSGTGFIIGPGKILSNAHVVSNARFLEVKKDDDPRRYPARILHIGHDCDTALLTVDDDTFFKGIRPVRFATTLPELGHTVQVLGYPVGGERLSLTRGVVSRVDYALYAHSGADRHLILQVDAAINPGNSGGPVLDGDRVVGMAFQGLSMADNIGYAIPVPVLTHFLEDIATGRYNGYPELGAAVMELRNPAMRADLGLPATENGVVVHYLDPFGSARGYLHEGDVLLAIDDYDISSDGSILIDGMLMEYSEVLERKQRGDRIRMRVWRDRREHTLAIPLLDQDDPFVFRNEYDKPPPYSMHAGLIFAPLSRGVLRAASQALDTPAGQQLLYYLQYIKQDGHYRNREAVIVLTGRLPHAVNAYHDPFVYGIVESVNGQTVASLAGLDRAMMTPTDGFHHIRFTGMHDVLVLDAGATPVATAAIMRQYAIPQRARMDEENTP